jgi:hypothetical protein
MLIGGAPVAIVFVTVALQATAALLALDDALVQTGPIAFLLVALLFATVGWFKLVAKSERSATAKLLLALGWIVANVALAVSVSLYLLFLGASLVGRPIT